MNRTEQYCLKECCLCGPSSCRLILSLWLPRWERTFSLWRCRSCDLEFVWPQPASASDLYDEDYYRNGYLAHEADRRRQFHHLLMQLGQRGASGPLLDVGAGIGMLVSAAKQQNWQPEGIEPSATACRLARELYGIHLTCGEIKELTPSPEFGVVVLWQVLAHAPDPQEVLRLAAKMLRPDGTLLVTCIRWDDPHYRLARFLTLWKKVNGLHIPTILWRFREGHLEELARRAGLRVQSLEYGPRPIHERFGWKRRLLEPSFEAYRKLTGTNEEVRMWCKPSTDTSRNSVSCSPSRSKVPAALSQAPPMLWAESTL